MISRRDFIKGSVAGAVGVAAMGVLGGCSQSTSSNNVSWDKEVDVLIVGGGGTGLAAALQAVSDGANVLVLEKAGIAGGTTSYSGGVMQAAATKYQKEYTNFKDDSPENHFQLWLKAGEGFVDEELVKDLAYGAPEHIEWLTDIGIKFTSVYGHTHIPYVDESLFADRIHVYEGGGGEGGGTVLIMAMLNAAIEKGAQIEYETEVTKLVTNDDGEVVGVIAKQGESEIKVKANKGVILAASSIDQNVEMAKDLSPQHHWDLTSQICLAAASDTGDGIRMAMEIGAAVSGFGGTIDFCGKTGAATDNRIPLFPSYIVNKKGNRFVCEDATYAYHYRAIFQQEKQLDGPTYMIFGESSLAGGAPWTEESVAKDVAEGVVFKANTIEELAKLISVDSDNLVSTMEKWNKDMQNEKDTQFDRKTGLSPISGPFYAYKNVSFNLGSIGGVKINVDAQALKPNGDPIPGLYAGGMNAGGWIGPYYPGSGTAIIGLIHWGRKAGAHAANL
ncbi:FAD-dependent oxidoreductase [Alkalibaculum sp. M08DMB]|uniref:FAD-dependent oxidoreductase n=1 Tax=Alkalibaculum sporogenes TaxID=2655001 RepID=A0A6A7KCY4_9FIRM|nr:FAD-dependent oxidoreductase [Alkalibaculum sporogenes]MPW27027.1 FAD-dependent oxidoreductase [Alkalibaculum sporogenes]